MKTIHLGQIGKEALLRIEKWASDLFFGDGGTYSGPRNTFTETEGSIRLMVKNRIALRLQKSNEPPQAGPTKSLERLEQLHKRNQLLRKKRLNSPTL